VSEFLRDLKQASHLLFQENPSTLWIRFRLWLAFKLIPKDMSNFIDIVLSKLNVEYEKLDSEKRNKISSLRIDFEFRE
jgi:hypothetical protein